MEFCPTSKANRQIVRLSKQRRLRSLGDRGKRQQGKIVQRVKEDNGGRIENLIEHRESLRQVSDSAIEGNPGLEDRHLSNG